MKRAAVITHALAVAAGLAVAAVLFPQPAADGGNPTATGPVLAAKSASRGERSSAPGPREMLEELSQVPMDPYERSNLKRELWSEWAKTDPEGVLRHLQGRGWPMAAGFFYGPSYAFDALARKNPEALIGYARKEGCGDAWAALCRNGDPRRILPLLLGKGSDEPVPADIFGTLFGRGLSVDSAFPEEFSKLKDPAQRGAAFAAATKELLERNRLDDYFRFIGDCGMEATVIGKEFGVFASENAGVVGEIGRFPEAVRMPAAAGVVNGLIEQSSTAEGIRTALVDLNEAGWWGWTASEPEWQEKLRHLLGDMFWGGDENEDPWCDWALKLPDGEVARVMKEVALHRWAAGPGPDWRPRLAAISDPALRDMATATLALGLPGEEEASAVVAMISDETLRKETAEELKARGDQADPFKGPREYHATKDPFAE